MSICFHKFVDGFGSMGDAVKCVKCGYSKYPEALALLDRLMCRVIKNDGTYGSQTEFPYVVKFDKTITFDTNWDDWTYYFGKDGKLHPRAELGAQQ